MQPWLDEEILRYCRQIVLKAMDKVRANMRGSQRLLLRDVIDNPDTEKSEFN